MQHNDRVEVSPTREGFRVVLETILPYGESSLLIKKVFSRWGGERTTMGQEVQNEVKREGQPPSRYIQEELVAEVERHQVRLHHLGLDICDRFEYMLGTLPPQWRKICSLEVLDTFPLIRWSLPLLEGRVEGRLLPHYFLREEYNRSLRYIISLELLSGETTILREEGQLRSLQREVAKEELLAFAGRTFFLMEEFLHGNAASLTNLFATWAPLPLQEGTLAILQEELRKVQLITHYVDVILQKLRGWTHVKHEHLLLEYRGVEELMELGRVYRAKQRTLEMKIDMKKRIMEMRREKC